MQIAAGVYSLPKWRVTRWLADAGPGVPDEIRAALIRDLFGTLPVFAAGVANTLLVSAAIAFRMWTAPFFFWLAFECTVCLARLAVLILARRAAPRKKETPTDLYLLLGVAWGLSVGYGAFISLTSGDWVAATLACLSAAAMVGGICFRNFGAPRLAATMILTSLGACLPGAAFSGQPLLYVVFLQGPMYLVAMTAAAFKLNKMLVATMRAERENERRASHDALTDLANRTGLARAFDIVRPARDGEAVSLFFLDLDDFKSVNDTYGHAAGDDLLRMVAARVRSVLRDGDIAARIGGDEFVVLARALAAEEALAFGREIRTAVSTSYELAPGVAVTVGGSIGIATAPEHGNELPELLAVADAALYQAKSGGKSQCLLASLATNLAALGRLREHVPPPDTPEIGAAA